MKTIYVTTKEMKEAEQKFNRLQNRFYTAISIMEEVLEEMPQKGNTEEECQKVNILCSIKDLEYKLSGTTVEDFLNK